MSFQKAEISCKRCSVLAHMLLVGDSATSVKKFVGKGLVEATEKATSADSKFYEARYRALEGLEQVFYYAGTSDDDRRFAAECLDACVTCDFSNPRVCAMIEARRNGSPPSP
ncbi:hypothetical protein HS125_05410 [bacterium]|nr:hypothetical protein [bacterium]